MSARLTIRELIGADEVAAAFSVMAVLRPRFTQEAFVRQVRQQQAEGYRLIGGFTPHALVVLAGIRDACTLSAGSHLFVDDLVTQPDEQGKGYGGQMLRWLARDAESRGLPVMLLQSRDTAKGFYEKMGFTLHKGIPCSIAIEKLVAEA